MVPVFFQVIAEENDPAKYKVLNYAPGPLDTQMVSKDIMGNQR